MSDAFKEAFKEAFGKASQAAKTPPEEFDVRHSCPATLEFQLITNRALLSDYALRTKQAEMTAGRLTAQMLGSWSKEQVQSFVELLNDQMQARATERAVQQQAILQATVVALNAAMSAEPETKEKMLKTILRELTASVQHLSKIEKAEAKSKSAAQ